MSSKKEDKKVKPAGKRPLVPKLRFPEFRDAGEWEVKPLRELAKRCTLKNGQGKLTRVLTNSAEFGVVDQRDFFDKDIANQNNLEGYYIVEKGDYVYNPRISASAPVGPVSKNNTATGVMSPLYTIFRFDNRQNDFYALFFKTTGWHHYMRRSSSTGARHDRIAITNDEFLALPLPVPPLAEQQKIAGCLSSLDELISLEAQRLDALKAHKKGMMQRLFPGEGETVPRLRFPEFRDAGEWEDAPAGQLFANRIERGRSSLPIYSVTMAEGLVPRAGLDRKIDDIADAGANKTVYEGDLAYNMMRMWQGALGVAPQDCMVSPAYIVLAPQGVNPYFFFYMFKMPHSLRVLTARSRGLTKDRLRLYYDDFAKVPVQYPSRPEQDRIADYLLSSDSLITVQSERLAALKTHKKGLMQQLFPAMDEALE